MPTLFDPDERTALRERLDLLREHASPQWGTMTAPQMLAHLDATVTYALAGGPGERGRGAMSYWPINKLVVHVLPWPKGGAKSPPAFLGREAEDFVRERNELGGRLEAAAARGSAADWPTSPVFGRLSGHDWGVLLWKHTDHHLRQFGL